MSVPAAEPPADAGSLARRGAITHLTIDGERIALIVPAALMDVMRILAGLLVSDEATAELAGLLPAVYPWAQFLPEPDLTMFAAEVRDTIRAGGPDAPEQLERVVTAWRGTAEVFADPELLKALLADGGDWGPVPAPASV